MSGDLWADGVLPVRDAWDERLATTHENAIGRRDSPGRFDDNAATISQEGKVSFVQFMYAYRTGRADVWRRALRDAYHMADIAFDHSNETIRMHNYPFDGTTSPRML